MAYVVSSGAHVLMTFRGTQDAQLVMNTWHYRLTGPIIADGAAALVNLVDVNVAAGNMFAAWKAVLSESVVDCVMEAQWIDPFRYRKVRQSGASTQGLAGHANACNQASVLTLASDEATRHGIGNKHLPGLPDDAQIDSLLGAGHLANMTNLGVLAKATITQGANTYVPVIYNRQSPAASFDVKVAFNNPYVRVQRRRTVGLGK